MRYNCVKEVAEVEKLLTVEQVADFLHTHPQVVRRWLRDGDLSGAKIAKRWLIDSKDLQAFVESKKRKGE